MKLAAAYSYLKTELNQIEKTLNETIHAKDPILREASQQLLKAGGKRIRPVFVLLAGSFGDYQFDRLKTVAVSLELIHMASLVHDDVIDEAELRRGKPTVKAKWDNRIAMYTGDYIFARSLEYLTDIDNPRAHRILSETIVELCIGELKQMEEKYNLDQSIRNYLRRIKRKTALLISSSSQLGAIASGAPKEYEQALMQYGYYVGMSYQIIDDILDFTSSSSELGKPAGGDLLQGNITLPVFYAMEDSDFKDALRQTLAAEEKIDPADIQPFVEHIKKSNAIDRAYAISEKYLNKAYEALEVLPNTRAKHSLTTIAKYIGKRKN
ncbi:heptaprenyl diphosphate synthase component II [Radiobacillus kanasensis]|uniref:heptaprenyl diphosphate synthase component II n=1 Tax=Radiobacillus kanasensis TaxID=2844358 RepID=UPI001E5D7BD5|nr:heptaprenyl diphosphate synthase component II [Radiobacillus kanasensis]UFT97626.1 heptaprenyl diphosphate synthase component II [Radiobacillus kanasensis]